MLHSVAWQTLTDVSDVLTAAIIVVLMMEKISTCETSVTFYKAA
jgi:hypothetical protein